LKCGHRWYTISNSHHPSVAPSVPSVLSVPSVASVSTVCRRCPLSCVIRLRCSCVICQSSLSCHPSIVAVSHTAHPPLCLPFPGNMSGVSDAAAIRPAHRCCHPPVVAVAVTCQPATHPHPPAIHATPPRSNMSDIPNAAAIRPALATADIHLSRCCRLSTGHPTPPTGRPCPAKMPRQYVAYSRRCCYPPC